MYEQMIAGYYRSQI